MYVKVFALCLVAVVSVSAAPGSRIVGGSNAPDGGYPHQVSVQYGLTFLHSHACGGTILNKKWVLTAGYCITEVPHTPFAYYKIQAGSNHLYNKAGQYIKVKNIVVHPDYKGAGYPNDIALLELERELVFNAKVAAVKLPAAGSIPSGEGILSGWGSSSSSFPPIMPNDLQHVTVPVITIDECRKALITSSGSAGRLADTNVCTGPLTGGISACFGDYGSPLVIKSNNSFEIIGIVSWGVIPCGKVNTPSIYTRISAFNDFINQHINN